ncbi:MAG TPA: WD40 repeat domain-containing protein [Gemmataceae bacterium]|nr:WD40 repeat domain-containing protein [Gemmataceae bacterium]
MNWRHSCRKLALVGLLILARGSASAGELTREKNDLFGDPLPKGALARFGTLRLRGDDATEALTFSPDGKLLASGGRNGVVRVWDAATGQELHTFTGHAETIRALAFVVGTNKPGTLLASGSMDGTVRFWDLASGKQAGPTLKHPNGVSALAVSPDGRLLATGADHRIYVWRQADGAELRKWIAHQGGVLSLAFTPDGKSLLSGGRAQLPITGGRIQLEQRGSDDYALALWDPLSGRRVRKFTQATYESRVIGYTADGRRWVSVGPGKDGITLRLWGADHQEKRVVNCPSTCSFDHFALSPDGAIVAASGSRQIHLWDIDKGKPLPPLKKGNDFLPLALAFSPDGRTLASGAVLARITLWDLQKGEPRHAFDAHQRGIGTLAVAPDGKTAVTGSYYDDEARLWDMTTGKTLRRFARPGVGLWQARFAPDGRTLALSHIEEITLWDIATGVLQRQIKARGRIVSLEFSPDGKTLASQSIDDEKLHLWDVQTGRERLTLSQQRGGSYYLAFSPTGERLASTTNDLYVWDVATGKLSYKAPCRGHQLTYSPDGLLLVAYSEPIRIFEADTGKELASLKWRVNHGGTWSLAFSPDGRYLAMTELEKVRLWEIATRRDVHTFDGHRGWTTSVAFTPDGKALLSGSEDTTAVAWDMTPFAANDKIDNLDALWVDMKDADRLKAYGAFCRLRQMPRETVALLEKRLAPIRPVSAERLDTLLRDLGSARFGTREQASRELEQLGDLAEPVLRRALAEVPLLETGRRCEQLLAKLPDSVEIARALWGVRLLEVLGTPAARAYLQRLAEGAAEARQTRQARLALRRLEQRSLRGTGVSPVR